MGKILFWIVVGGMILLIIKCIKIVLKKKTIFLQLSCSTSHYFPILVYLFSDKNNIQTESFVRVSSNSPDNRRGSKKIIKLDI